MCCSVIDDCSDEFVACPKHHMAWHAWAATGATAYGVSADGSSGRRCCICHQTVVGALSAGQLSGGMQDLGALPGDSSIAVADGCVGRRFGCCWRYCLRQQRLQARVPLDRRRAVIARPRQRYRAASWSVASRCVGGRQCLSLAWREMPTVGSRAFRWTEAGRHASPSARCGGIESEAFGAVVSGRLSVVSRQCARTLILRVFARSAGLNQAVWQNLGAPPKLWSHRASCSGWLCLPDGGVWPSAGGLKAP
jgi:hypothetical protein